VTLAIVEPAPEQWDRFVAAHPQGHLLQQGPWGGLKSAYGWRVLRVAVAGRSDAPPVGRAVPLLAGAQILFRTRYGVSVAYVPRGPLFAGDPQIDTLLLATLRRVARRRRAVFLRLEPAILEHAPDADSWHTWLLLRGFTPADPIQPRSTIHVDLAPPPDQIFASFRKGHRADIRRAERQQVQVRVGDAGDIDSFYAILEYTGQRAAFGIHERGYYRQAWERFQPQSRLLLAALDGQDVAGHMVFHNGRGGAYLYSGATEPGLKSGANHLLEWHALQWAREQGCTYYDLWGIPDALGLAAIAEDAEQRAAFEAAAQDDPLIGVYRFKKGFGGQVVRYLPAYDQVYLPPLYTLWRRRLS
jgi:lipid II:glycine glycyltransferase (peptidoglycan interpeptide bridge formation enzyme)